MMNKEQRELNLKIYLEKLSQLGINVEDLESKYGEKLMNAPFTHINDHGMAQEGTLLDIVLRVLTPFAVRINELLSEKNRVDKETLVKVCLLHHIAKSVRLVRNDNVWEVEKRAMTFKYDENQPSIRTGLHSMLIAQECGINFTAEEAEAMTVNDRDMTDDQARWHSSKMATIIRQANELTYLVINEKK